MPMSNINEILIGVGLCLLIALAPMVYAFKKKQYVMVAVSYVLTLVLSVLLNLIPFGFVASGFSFYWCYTVEKRKSAKMQDKNRKAYNAHREEMDKEGIYFIPDSKSKNVWPPVENNVIDQDALKEFLEYQSKEQD